jgi:hypothetical protein
MNSMNSYMFQHQTAILRKATKTKERKSNTTIHVWTGNQYLNWHVRLRFLCFSRLPLDGTLVLKHAGVNTDHELYFVVFYQAHLLVDILNIRKCMV